MKLSIITINYNNASGLKKTMESVFAQTCKEIEYIVIDGASTDESVQIIQQFNNQTIQQFNWISEPDNGIYNAMNKGIKIAKGEYLQFLNSGDCLVAPDVTEKMIEFLVNQESRTKNQENIKILYGNMLKQLPKDKGLKRDKGFAGRQPTMLDFYIGTLNHSPAYIRRDLFDKFGLYDETLKIVADWKWYLQVIIFGGIVPVYADFDVTLFDMNGISTVNDVLDKTERKQVLKELLPKAILTDYEKYAFQIEQVNRINKYWLTRTGFWLVERMLFKWEKWNLIKRM